MDAFDILTPTETDGRRAALALQEMGLRAVVAPDGLRLVSMEPTSSSRRSQHVTAAGYQPRDEQGRFVAYWVLSAEFVNDFIDIEYEYGLEDCPEGPRDLS